MLRTVERLLCNVSFTACALTKTALLALSYCGRALNMA